MKVIFIAILCILVIAFTVEFIDWWINGYR